MGPDIPEIAKRLGQYKESVRYRYKTKILEKGFAVQAMMDHEKLGLRRAVMITDFGSQYEEYARQILIAMSDLCYVVGFEKTVPKGSYIIDASKSISQVSAQLRWITMNLAEVAKDLMKERSRSGKTQIHSSKFRALLLVKSPYKLRSAASLPCSPSSTRRNSRC
ncbi:MAG: hypothetical protein LYZ69_03335 [Nitrososphaerales archaeon]|nr:hypothetical protein [Nitrososphaerales archaeon]